MGGRLPTGVVTFVMSDIESSTRLWDLEPRAMSVAVRDHAEIIEGVVRSNEGHLVKERGEGDSTFSVFARTSDAVRAGYEVQLKMAEHRWATSVPVRLRIAIHTGEAVEADGDYLGTALNRTARLRSIAEPGETILSAACAAVVADNLPYGTELRSLGAARLRGLKRDEDVFALAGGGLMDPSRRRRGAAPATLLDERGVTRRERDVFDAIGDRLTNAEIAERFSVSERTIESHVSSLLRKLEVRNRLELSDLAKEIVSSRTAAELPPMLAMAAQRSGCLGRGPQRLQLLDLWRQAVGGQTTLAVITGEAGIGKSRLVADLAVQVHDLGGLVLLGSSTDGGGPPFQPFVEALSPPIALSSEHQLRHDLGRSAHDLAWIVPEIRTRLDVHAGATTRVDDAQAIPAAIHNYLQRMAQRHPTLVVLEDMHWASRSTRDVVVQIARRIGTAPLCVVCTSRDTAPDLDEALTAWFAGLERLPGVTWVPLAGLDRQAITAVLDELGHDADPAAALRSTSGNPLLLREFAQAGVDGATLQDFVADRRGRLGDEDLAVVDTAAVIGESFALDVLARAMGWDAGEVIGSLERCRAAGLVEPVTTTRYVFLHALVRDACYHTVSMSRRLQVHAQIAAALAGQASEPAVLPQLARHAALAVPLTDADQAVELSRQAGEQALLVGDLTEAGDHFDRALDIVDLTRDPAALRLPLSIRLGEALALPDKPRGLRVLREAARLARRAADAESFADAVCSMTTWGGSISPGQRDEMFISLAEEALELLPESSLLWRARVTALLGAHLALSDEHERGRDLARTAVELARAAGDTETFVRAVLSLRYTLNDYDHQERRRLNLEALEVASRAGLDGLAELCAAGLAQQAHADGDLEESRRWYRRGRELTEANSVGIVLWSTIEAFLAGDLDGAEELNQQTLTALPPDLAPLYVGSMTVVISLMRGASRPELLEPFVELDSFVGANSRVWLALGRLADGETAAAAEMLEAELTRGLAASTQLLGASVILAGWAEVAAATSNPTAAAELKRYLDPLAGRLADNGPTTWGSVDYSRSLLALTLGEHDKAVLLATEAASASRRRRTPIFLGRELVALAAAQVASGATPSQVAPILEVALEIARTTGAAVITHDAKRWGIAEEADTDPKKTRP